MRDKRKPHYIIDPRKEDKGVLLWLNLTASHFGDLFYANIIAVVCLIPAFYFLLLFARTLSLPFQLISALLFSLAGPALTLLFGTACRVSLRRPVWIWEDLKAILKNDLLKSFALGLIVAVMWSVVIDAVYLMYSANGGVSAILLVFALAYVYLCAGFSMFSFQQLAMLDISFGEVLKNGILLVFAGGIRSFFSIVLTVAVLSVCAYFYGIGSILAIGGVPAWMIMTSDCIFAPVFRRLFMENSENE